MDKRYFILIPALFILLVSGVIYFSEKNKVTTIMETNPSTSSPLDKIGQTVNLPQNLTPTMIYIKDINKAKNQPFLVGAKNGDIILLYPDSKLAILYDPVANRVIQSGPLIMATDSSKLDLGN